METTFYDDNNLCVKKMKTNMTLDLSKSKDHKLQVPTSEMGLFITTPELERLITQNSNPNFILTTPTPTTNILFPKHVTEEQEAYARGFVDALGKLHKNNPPTTTISPIYTSLDNIITTPNNETFSKANLPTTVNSYNFSNNQPTPFLPNNFQQQQPTDMKTINSSTVSSLLNHNNNLISQNYDGNFYYNKVDNFQNTNNNSFTALNTIIPAPNTQHQMIKSESYHTVPHSPASVSSRSSSQASPLNLQNNNIHNNNFQPINMDFQETAKLERKRARNRVAATKCRNRKLERIVRLEMRVKDLKDQNLSLVQSSGLLKEQVRSLKNTIISHTNQGCQVMLTNKFLDSNLDFS